MIGAQPKTGWVLRYSYLRSEEGGSDVDVKERPAVVVLAVKRTQGRTLVRVAPVTHREPADPARAIEIPAVTKQRLGLDRARSWIILHHANEFVWPGPDLLPVPGTNPPTIYYGPLPPRMFDALRRRLFSLLRARRQTAVLRGE